MSEEAPYTLQEVKQRAPALIASVQAAFQAASEKFNLPEPRLVPVKNIRARKSGLADPLYTIATVSAGSLTHPDWASCSLHIMGRKTGLTLVGKNKQQGDAISLGEQDFAYQCERAVVKMANPVPFAPQ